MYDEVQVLTHSSIRISKGVTVYFDPYEVDRTYADADIIFITHDHYDHYSPKDIAKVKNSSSVLVCPASMEASLLNSGVDEEFIELVEPGDQLEINDIEIEVVPAYNIDKQFHPQKNKWVGYIVTIDDIRYYVAGDTDANEAIKNIDCNVALLPVGGTYTMTAAEAAKLAIILKPDIAIPTHYGTVVGSPDDGKQFVALLKGEVNACTKL